MSDEIAIARLIESLPESVIADALLASDVSLTALSDVYDIAAMLDRPESVDARMRWLTLAQARALAKRPASCDVARELVLVDAEGAPLDRVAERLSDLSGSPGGAAAVPEPLHAEIPGPPPLESAARRGFATVRLVYGLVIGCAQAPPHALGKGGLARADRTTLASFLSVDPSELDPLLALAESAGLVRRTTQNTVAPTPAAAAWMRLPQPAGLASLVSGWLGALPGPLAQAATAALRAEPDAAGWWDAVARELPLGGEARDRFEQPSRHLAERLGLSDGGRPTPLVPILLGQAPGERDALLAGYCGQEIDYVYPQADASIIVPGVLRPDLEQRLRSCARCTQFGDASTYAVSDRSIGRALALGMTVEEIVTLLDELSRGGLPQPIRYRIADVAGRFGEVQVARAETGSVVRTASESLAATLAHDRALGVLMLRPVDGSAAALTTRIPPEIVTNAIADARYSVVLLDDAGRVVGGAAQEEAPEFPESAKRVSAYLPRSAAEPKAVAAATALAAKVHTHTTGADPAALATEHLSRRLELAIKHRHLIRIVVAMPEDDHAEFLLEPTGLGGGRLRGRDTAVQTERTFPVNRILRADAVAADKS